MNHPHKKRNASNDESSRKRTRCVASIQRLPEVLEWHVMKFYGITETMLKVLGWHTCIKEDPDKTLSCIATMGDVGLLHKGIAWTRTHIDEDDWFLLVWNCLNIAAKKGHVACIRFLISLRCNHTALRVLSEAECSGALRLSAGNGHLGCVEALIPVSEPRDRLQALISAAKFGHMEIVKTLVPVCSETAIPIAMIEAARFGHIDILKYYRKMCTDPEDVSIALLLAERHGHEACVREIFIHASVCVRMIAIVLNQCIRLTMRLHSVSPNISRLQSLTGNNSFIHSVCPFMEACLSARDPAASGTLTGISSFTQARCPYFAA